MSGRSETSLADSVVAPVAGIGLLGAIVVVHLADVREKFEEVPYLGVGYVLLIGACVVAAGLLAQPNAVWRERRWIAGGATAALTLLGFVLTRTVGLPSATDDIGNWHEMLGVWSFITEGAMVLLSAIALSTARRTSRALV
jgi:hypothetical protein